MKKILFIGLLIFGVNTKFLLGRVTTIPKNTLEQFAEGNVSEQNKNLILDIAQIFSIQTPLEIRKPSFIGQGMVPLMHFVLGFKGKEKNPDYIFINEEWFDTLSDSEKKYIVGYELVRLQRSEKNEFIKSTIIPSVFQTIEIGLAVQLYRYLGTRETFLGFNTNWRTKLLTTFLGALALEIIMAPMAEWANDRVMISIDCFVVEKLQCVEGALAVLNKIKNHIEDHYIQQIYWRRYRDFINKRIKKLETLKKLQ